MAQESLISIPSTRSAAELISRLEAALAAKGVTVFARIDHGAGAAAVGLPLRPTIVLIFGNPAAGTPLMQAEQTIGLDLPLKILVWEDESGTGWLSYHEPVWLAACHGIDPAAQPSLAAMTKLLHALATEAAEG